MKSALGRAILGLAAMIGFGVAVSEIWPPLAARFLLSGIYAYTGLQKEVTDTSFGPVHYLEGGQGDTIVFLHGIFGRKEHWIEMSLKVTGEYRVILLDLPGFGENPRLDVAEYDYARQTAHVVEALSRIGLNDFHIAANSMGAQIAAMIAATSPDRVRSLAFIGGPVGVTSPRRSEMERAIVAGDAPLVVTTEGEHVERMSWLFLEAPFIPRPIARTWLKREVSEKGNNSAIWETVYGSKATRLEDIAPELTQPSLLVWCTQDRIFHVSGAEVLHKALPDNSLVVADACGHLPMLDRASQTGLDVLNFLRKQSLRHTH